MCVRSPTVSSISTRLSPHGSRCALFPKPFRTWHGARDFTSTYASNTQRCRLFPQVQKEVPRVLQFGPFELRTDTGELRRNGVRVKLQGKAFQILHALLERPG